MYCSKQNPMITSPQKHSQSKLFKLMLASSVCVQHPSIITELYQHEHEQIAPQVPRHPSQRLLIACFGWVWTSHTNSHTLKQTCTCVARGNPLFCDLLLINFDYRPGDLICLIWHVCVCVCVLEKRCEFDNLTCTLLCEVVRRPSEHMCVRERRTRGRRWARDI